MWSYSAVWYPISYRVVGTVISSNTPTRSWSVIAKCLRSPHPFQGSNFGRFRASKLSVGLTFHGQTLGDNVPGNSELCPADSAGFSPALPRQGCAGLCRANYGIHWRCPDVTTSPELSVSFFLKKRALKNYPNYKVNRLQYRPPAGIFEDQFLHLDWETELIHYYMSIPYMYIWSTPYNIQRCNSYRQVAILTSARLMAKPWNSQQTKRGRIEIVGHCPCWEI